MVPTRVTVSMTITVTMTTALMVSSVRAAVVLAATSVAVAAGNEDLAESHDEKWVVVEGRRSVGTRPNKLRVV